jgi:hypothetical protein
MKLILNVFNLFHKFKIILLYLINYILIFFNVYYIIFVFDIKYLCEWMYLNSVI